MFTSNTDVTRDYGNVDFVPTDTRLVFGLNGNGRATYIYEPSAEARRHDGVCSATHSVGSRFGGFPYIILKVTGRKLRHSVLSEPALKCKVTIGLDTGCDEDREIVDAWLTGDLSKFMG